MGGGEAGKTSVHVGRGFNFSELGGLKKEGTYQSRYNIFPTPAACVLVVYLYDIHLA